MTNDEIVATIKSYAEKMWTTFVVNKASRCYFSGVGCTYSHHPDVNMFGCAVGCLLPADVALQVQTKHFGKNLNTLEVVATLIPHLHTDVSERKELCGF